MKDTLTEIFFYAQSSFPYVPNEKNFYEVGKYKHRWNLNKTHFFDAESYEEPKLDEIIETFISCNNVITKKNEHEDELINSLFHWFHLEIIKNKF